jgi:formate hydrogenlyase subunit 3/multisubunit Na+/H+ antiporter MnhD subunit
MTACALAIVVLVGSGVIALAARRRPLLAGGVAAAGALAAAALGVPTAIAVLNGAMPPELRLGGVSLGLDPLSALFAVPLFVLGAASAVYGAFYLDRRRLGVPALALNVMLGAMLLVLLARHAMVFLVGWEIMTIASFVLVTHDDATAETRHAGWIYLVMSHVGFACLVALFVLLGGAGPLDPGHPAGGATGTVALVLALVGFGVKAGIVPLHIWLPEAHSAAPSHVSAMMSGGMIKLGIYGILRTITLVEPTAWIGPVLAGFGALSAIAGIALALYQRDLKRTLAYSSIENIGVVLLGIGTGLWGVAAGRPVVAAFGLFGGLLHVWSHALMKGLLFLGAGSILHATGTRDIEHHGGLLARMPRTGLLLVIGATAIAALPPFAGFTSEWLVYLGLLDGGVHTHGAGLFMLLGVTALALVGVLATLCFVRAIGLALLGQPRSERAAGAHESGAGIVGPMLLLAAGVVALPLVAPLIARALVPVVAQVARAPVPVAPVIEALGTIAVASAVVWIAFAIGQAVLRRGARVRRIDETWGCGYGAPTSRMQYTSGSFAEAAQHLLPGPLRPRIVVRRDAGPFPGPGELTSDRRDPFARSGYEPAIGRLDRRLGRLRWVQRGHLHVYLLFIAGTVVAMLAAVSFYDWWVR